MADDIEEAAEIAIGLAIALETPEVFDEERLEKLGTARTKLRQLLKIPEIGGPLSLANPYPVEVAGVAAVSYAACVELLFANMPRLWPLTLHCPLALNCAKEYERATGKACDVDDAVEKVSRNKERDEWIVSQDSEGSTLKEIRDAIPKRNRDWWPLTTDQAVYAVLKRRGKR